MTNILILDYYCTSASIIEASRLDYTILRPAWLNDRDEIHYGTTQKGEPFRNAVEQVSRKSVADIVVKLATTPGSKSAAVWGCTKRTSARRKDCSETLHHLSHGLVGGREIDGAALSAVMGKGEYEATGAKLHGDAWICGRTTMQAALCGG